MENDERKRSEIAKALDSFFAKNPNRGPTPAFRAYLTYLNTLDAMGVYIVVYLVAELQVPSSSAPALLPMIDRRWFADHLNPEIDDLLKKLD